MHFEVNKNIPNQPVKAGQPLSFAFSRKKSPETKAKMCPSGRFNFANKAIAEEEYDQDPD